MQQVRFYSRGELLDTQRDWQGIVPTIHQQIDERLNKVEGLACKEGCAHCCKLQVTALPHEIVDVVEYIRFGDRFTRDQRAEILERLKDVVALTDGMGPDAYREADVPCPFLSESNRCIVYSARPMACRAFGSTNVSVCDLSTPDDGVATFRVVPDSLMRLLATSGLFYVPFLQSCLDWWQSEGLKAEYTEAEAAAIAGLQALIDAGIVGSDPAPVIQPVKRGINGYPR
jgi:Fe-S-cluster containining protein